MNNKKNNISIPKLLGIILFIIPPFFIFFDVYIGLKFEKNPSSTSGIAYITGPILGIIYGTVLGIIGIIIGKIIKSYTNFKRVDIKKGILCIFIITLLTIIIGSYIGYLKSSAWNKIITPKIYYSKINLKAKGFKSYDNKKIVWKDKLYKNIYGKRNAKSKIKLVNGDLVIQGQINETIWNNKTIYLCHDWNNIYLLTRKSEDLYELFFKDKIDISYITNVIGGEVQFNERYYILLVTLRATLNKSLLLLYDTEKNMIYKELLDRVNDLDIFKYNNQEHIYIEFKRGYERVYYYSE